MPPDPLDVLRQPDEPVTPRSEFAAALRRRIVAALAPTDPVPPTAMEETTMATETTTQVSTTLIPYLAVIDAAAAIDFYTQAFGAVEEMRMTDDDGRVGHASIAIDGVRLFLADEHPEIGVLGPATLGGTAVSLMLQVADVDATFERAVALGATAERPPSDQFYGDRSGWLVDPFGHRWGLSTPIEEVSREEMQRRVGDSYDLS